MKTTFLMVPREDTITAIYPLLKSIFKGYCTIFNNLAGSWSTFESQFQEALYQVDVEHLEDAYRTAIRSVQSYILMDELQDDRDAIFVNYLRNALNSLNAR